MASPPRLPKNLRAALGPDAAEDLVTIVDEMRSERQERRREIRDDFDGFRREMRSDMQALEERLNGRFAKIDDRFDRVDARFDRVDARFGELEAKVGDVKSDLMKWSFVFWCGAVAAVAALAGVLRP